MSIEKQYIRKMFEEESSAFFKEIQEKFPEATKVNLRYDAGVKCSDLVEDFLSEIEVLMDKEEFENYLKDFKAVLYRSGSEQSVRMEISIYGSYGDQRNVNGHVETYVRINGYLQGSARVYAGFYGNPIGKVEHKYTISDNAAKKLLQGEEETIVAKLDWLLSAMISARKASLADCKAYGDYVAATGDMS